MDALSISGIQPELPEYKFCESLSSQTTFPKKLQFNYLPYRIKEVIDAVHHSYIWLLRFARCNHLLTCK